MFYWASGNKGGEGVRPNPRTLSPYPYGVTFAERADPMGYTPLSLFRSLNTEPGFHTGLQQAQTRANPLVDSSNGIIYLGFVKELVGIC